MNRIKNLLKDLVKALLLGMAAALAAAVLLLVSGLFFGKGGVDAGLETAKNGVFLIAALLLFLLAGMLIVKGKKPDREEKGLRKHFEVIGFKTAAGMAAVAFVTVGAVADFLQRYLHSL